MTRARVLGLVLVLLAVSVPAIEQGVLAGSALDTGKRSVTADVAGNDVAYHSWKKVHIKVTTLVAFSDRIGLIVWNNSTVDTRFTWVETGDTGNALDTTTQCATTTVGSRCEVKFAGNGLANGTYNVDGFVYGDTSPRKLNSTLNNIQLTVEACLSC